MADLNKVDRGGHDHYCNNLENTLALSDRSFESRKSLIQIILVSDAVYLIKQVMTTQPPILILTFCANRHRIPIYK